MNIEEMVLAIVASTLVGLLVRFTVVTFLTAEGGNSVRKRKIYISGPITGDPNYRKVFNYYEEAVRIKFPEAEILNPVTFCADIPDGSRWETYMDRCRIVLREEATDIFMIPGWTNSRGAQEEFEISRFLRLGRVYSSDLGLNETVIL
jgi:hypothetical protein